MEKRIISINIPVWLLDRLQDQKRKTGATISAQVVNALIMYYGGERDAETKV